MVEGSGFENRRTGNGTRGSNPFSSAKSVATRRRSNQSVESGAENLAVRSVVKIASELGVALAELTTAPKDRSTKIGRPPRGDR